MTVEVLDESGAGLDLEALEQLAAFVMDRMRLHPQAEMCLLLVDEDTITAHNQRWMGADGPTDVLAWPIDMLTPGHADGNIDDLPQGYLGDVALCPAVAARQADSAGHSLADEADLLTVHGILHLLGYDHAEPEEHRVMFALQARLLAEWQGVREGQPLIDEADSR
jgi:probable rRNA maturation factor